MDCNNCKHCGGIIPGSSHHVSCKVFPDFKLSSTLSAGVLLMHASPISATYRNKEGVKVTHPNPMLSVHGIANGWCTWPLDFDPIWVDSCLWFAPNVHTSPDLVDDTSNPES